MRVHVALLVASLMFVNASLADTLANKISVEEMARKAVSAPPEESAAALASLRAEGPAGLRAFIDVNAAELDRAWVPTSEADRRKFERLTSILDALCQQHDCYASRLYWYTDFEQAKAAALATGKPILSLRLLGKLDEDLSCANSRFFRIALYANADVSRFLRENFVLHWKSVRPAPRVTIDFGDGRKLERTLTGNSIHYVLDSHGRVVDALPGLYGPQAFVRELTRASGAAADSESAATESERAALLAGYHQLRLAQLAVSWAADTASLTPPPSRELPVRLESAASPSAMAAAPKAISKSVVEVPLLRKLGANTFEIDRSGADAGWKRIAELHSADSRLDEGSKALMRRKAPMLYEASPNAAATFAQDVRNFERAIAEDTVRNEYVFHSQIHKWLVDPRSSADVDVLNERIYSSLFLTPGSDPWLGLMSGRGYSGIQNDGVRQ